jgi:hypothetical protein
LLGSDGGGGGKVYHLINYTSFKHCTTSSALRAPCKRIEENQPEILQQSHVFSGGHEDTLQPAQLLPCILFEQTVPGIYVQHAGAIKNVKKTHTT